MQAFLAYCFGRVKKKYFIFKLWFEKVSLRKPYQKFRVCLCCTMLIYPAELCANAAILLTVLTAN